MDIHLSIDDRGFAIVPRMLGADALDALAESFRVHEEAAVPMSSEVLFTHAPPPAYAARGMRRLMDQWLSPHRRASPFSTRAAAAAVQPSVEAWLGERAVLFQDVLMDKTAAHHPFPWHQDFPFWPVDAPIGLVVWAPLDPVDAPSGGLALAERSHIGGVSPAIDLHTGAAQPGCVGTVLDVTQYNIARPRLDPGDVIVFHPLAWHASPANRSGRRRRVWASTWLGASARWSLARAPRHPLCRTLVDGAPVGPLGGEPK